MTWRRLSRTSSPPFDDRAVGNSAMRLVSRCAMRWRRPFSPDDAVSEAGAVSVTIPSSLLVETATVPDTGTAVARSCVSVSGPLAVTVPETGTAVARS